MHLYPDNSQTFHSKKKKKNEIIFVIFRRVSLLTRLKKLTIKILPKIFNLPKFLTNDQSSCNSLSPDPSQYVVIFILPGATITYYSQRMKNQQQYNFFWLFSRDLRSSYISDFRSNNKIHLKIYVYERENFK